MSTFIDKFNKAMMAQNKEFKKVDLGEIAIILTRGEISKEDVEKARLEYKTKYENANSAT